MLFFDHSQRAVGGLCMTVCVQTMSKIRLTEIVNCPDNFSHSYGLILVGAGLVSDKISTFLR